MRKNGLFHSTVELPKCLDRFFGMAVGGVGGNANNVDKHRRNIVVEDLFQRFVIPRQLIDNIRREIAERVCPLSFKRRGAEQHEQQSIEPSNRDP